jgi:hypothetical protein
MDAGEMQEPGPEMPSLELALEVRLRFYPLPKMVDVPAGGNKGIVVVESGSFAGPNLRGTVVSASGGDFATFRADGVVLLDARYMLMEEDGTPIFLYNRGFVWGRDPGVMPRFSRVAAGEAGVSVDPSEYYFRTTTTFDAPQGRHEWLTRHAFVGAGARLKDGNLVRYYKVT